MATRESLAHGISGMMGYQITTLIVYPLELMTVKQQVDDKQVSSRNKSLGSTFGLLCDTINNEGYRALYKGVVPTLETSSISYFIYFYTYAYTTHILRTTLKMQPSVTSDLLKSAIAGIINVLATNPLWVASVKLKIGGPNRNSDDLCALFRELKKVKNEDGFKALYAGLTSSLILVLNPIIQFSFYHFFKRNFAKPGHIGSFKAFIFGALSKFIATIATYPLQVAQNRLRFSTTSVKHSVGRNINTFTCLLEIYTERGLAGLFSGIKTKLISSMCNSALMFLFYERVVNLIKSQLKVV